MKWLIVLALIVGCAKKPKPTITPDRVPDKDEVIFNLDKIPEKEPYIEDTPVTIPDLKPIMFTFDSYELQTPPGEVLAYLGEISNTVWLEGHTCDIGSTAYNQALGEHRAAAVKDYLTAGGIADRRITIISYGEERPISDIKALNRRVEIKIGE